MADPAACSSAGVHVDPNATASACPHADLVIVGASEAAVHLMERLPESVFCLKKAERSEGPTRDDRVVVVTGDAGVSSGDWMASARAKSTRLRLWDAVGRATLPSQCPSTDPTALKRWVERKQRLGEAEVGALKVVPWFDGFVESASLGTVDHFLSSRIKQNSKRKMKVIKDKLASISTYIPEAAEKGEKRGDDNANEGNGPALQLRLTLSSGSTLTASHVVLADDGFVLGHANMPPWVGRIDLASKVCRLGRDDAGRADGEKQPASQIWESLHFAESDLDLTKEDVSGKVICIVGGGMTSAHLAEEAIKSGAKHVYLVCRSPLKVKEFEAANSWMGTKSMRPFLKLKSARERIKVYKKERGQGTITTKTKQILDGLVESSRLEVLQETQISTAALQFSDGMWQIELDNNEKDAILADAIWVATGRSTDVASEPVLQNISQTLSLPSMGGFPVLNDETLAWAKAPVYFMGSSASISLGPVAKSTIGYRTAAEKIARAVLSAMELGTESMEVGPTASSCFVDDEAMLCDGEGPNEEDHEDKPVRHEKRDPFEGAEVIRHTIEHYEWSDCEFDIDLYIRVGEQLNRENVFVDIGTQSLQVWAKSTPSNKVHHLHIPRLYKPIQLEKSYFKVIERKGKIVVHLAKTDSHEWRFLKA